MGRLQWVAEGGSFVTPAEVQWMRAAIYKHYAVTRPEYRLKSIRVLLATPQSNRIEGMEEIRTYFQRNGVGKRGSRDV